MGLRRVFDILDIEPDVTDSPNAVPLAAFREEIRYENVKFAYEADRPVLDGVSFSAKPGSITAIIGPTGSGKSTLSALLLRLFDPDDGAINHRRQGPARLPTAVGAQERRHRPARECAVLPCPCATTSAMQPQPPATNRSAQPYTWPPWTTTWPVCRTAWIPCFRTAAASCPPANANGCPSPERWCAIRPFWSSMSPPRLWTRPPNMK